MTFLRPYVDVTDRNPSLIKMKSIILWTRGVCTRTGPFPTTRTTQAMDGIRKIVLLRGVDDGVTVQEAFSDSVVEDLKKKGGGGKNRLDVLVLFYSPIY